MCIRDRCEPAKELAGLRGLAFDGDADGLFNELGLGTGSETVSYTHLTLPTSDLV